MLSRLWHDRDRPLSRDYSKVSLVKGEDATAVALGAGDYRRINIAEREVGITRHEGLYTRYINRRTVHGEHSSGDISQQLIQNTNPHPYFDEIRQFTHHSGRDNNGWFF